VRRRLTVTVVGLALVAGACASLTPPAGRAEIIRRAVASSVQLRAEWGDARRSGSGVVVASDAAVGRSWIVTAGHLLDRPGTPAVHVTVPGGKRRLSARILRKSSEADLAILEIDGVVLPAVALRETVRLGDEVWVVGFPWGKRLTVVSGVVSEIAAAENEVELEGAPRLVDAPASYGSSGGGVFDAATGALIGIVEGYHTVRVTIDRTPERTIDLPAPGETTVLGVPDIRRFLREAGVLPVE
jgi:S1-C subfamily serine protease